MSKYRYAPGFVKLNRIALQEAVEDLPIRSQPLARLFLLEGVLRSNWELGWSHNARVPTWLERGSFVMGLHEMAETLASTPEKIRTLLKNLKKVEKITISVTKLGHKITLKDFDIYTSLVGLNPKEDNKEITNSPQTDNNSREEQNNNNKRPPLSETRYQTPSSESEIPPGDDQQKYYLKFSEKPSECELKTLKSVGFSYHPESKRWIALMTDAAADVLENYRGDESVERGIIIKDGEYPLPTEREAELEQEDEIPS